MRLKVGNDTISRNDARYVSRILRILGMLQSARGSRSSSRTRRASRTGSSDLSQDETSSCLLKECKCPNSLRNRSGSGAGLREPYSARRRWLPLSSDGAPN
mmetsp:Transcript_10655/g.19222  ORF Transcript_10655/g.19222 Transcript_10655/m.19222 type:complete len:101 (-) Transcript_10655:200-502(-)